MSSMPEQLNDNHCVFALTQVSNQFGCEYARLVTRRSGPDIACTSAEMSQKCALVHERLKKVGLDEFDYEDDLTQVPHGIWTRIQFGGLLGLQETIQGTQDKIENISALVKLAENKCGDIDSIPFTELVTAMKSYKSRKRKR